MGSNVNALRLVGMLFLGLLLSLQPGIASGQEDQNPESGKAAEEPAAEPAEESAEEAAADPADGEEPVKLIKMFAEEWKWTPNLIRVAQGTRIKIEFLSYGASRRFDLKGYNLKVRIPQGKLVSVEFVADKKGTFRWRCGRPCGNGCAKMTGKLIVE